MRWSARPSLCSASGLFHGHLSFYHSSAVPIFVLYARGRIFMAETTIKLYGTNWCSDCKRSKKFLGEQRIAYEYINIEEDLEGQAYVQRVQNGGMTIPTILFGDGSLLIEPTNAELAAKLGLETKAKCDFYDLIIVGGGSTALATAIFA